MTAYLFNAYVSYGVAVVSFAAILIFDKMVGITKSKKGNVRNDE